MHAHGAKNEAIYVGEFEVAWDEKIRPWREIAEELQREQDPQRILELASELTEPWTHRVTVLRRKRRNGSPRSDQRRATAKFESSRRATHWRKADLCWRGVRRNQPVIFVLIGCQLYAVHVFSQLGYLRLQRVRAVPHFNRRLHKFLR
jgi:hypothetical protein